jgi:23S rRNA pseudouridine1911/1915/1917 synthase
MYLKFTKCRSEALPRDAKSAPGSLRTAHRTITLPRHGFTDMLPPAILPFTFHLSPFAFHFSPYSAPITNHQSPITFHSSRIIYESPACLVCDKPAHLLIHPKKPDGTVTLWHQLTQLLAFEIANGGQVSVITRLDRETSGLVLVAKTRDAARDLHTQIEKGRLTKRYFAIIWGWPDSDEFEVDQPLLRLGTISPSKIWLKQAVHPSGYPSQTCFRVIKRFENRHGKFALLECEPLTGRTHQIRVHLAFSGHPIVGDKIYGPDETCYLEFIETGWTQALAQKLLLDRHALHAASLAFTLGSEEFSFSSAAPDDLQTFMTETPGK